MINVTRIEPTGENTSFEDILVGEFFLHHLFLYIKTSPLFDEPNALKFSTPENNASPAMFAHKNTIVKRVDVDITVKERYSC